MRAILKALLVSLSRCFQSRRDLVLENLALRQQLAVLAAKHPRPRLAARDRLFWVILRRCWTGWRKALLMSKPPDRRAVASRRIQSVLQVDLAQAPSFRQKASSKALRELIFRMVADNPTWGAPRIHGELKMLGLDISERTVLRWMRKAPRNPDPARRWAAFLSNHREAIAAIGLLHSPNNHFRHAVLLLRHCA